MARVSATASLGMKLGLGHKPGHTTYDNASPHHSFTVEREYDESLTDEELAEKASGLHKLARKLVEDRIQADIKEIRA